MKYEVVHVKCDIVYFTQLRVVNELLTYPTKIIVSNKYCK